MALIIKKEGVIMKFLQFLLVFCAAHWSSFNLALTEIQISFFLEVSDS